MRKTTADTRHDSRPIKKPTETHEENDSGHIKKKTDSRHIKKPTADTSRNDSRQSGHMRKTTADTKTRQQTDQKTNRDT